MIGRESTFFRIIGSSRTEIDQIRRNISRYYYEKKEPKTDQFGNTRFKNGKPEVRILHPSTGRLKTLQKLIQHRIFSSIPLPSVVHGSVKKKSSITNARAHQGNKYFILTDLRNYFPSIHFSIVYEQLVEQGFSPRVASLITRLVTFNKSIPQGAPTSPFISNLVFQPQDLQLISRVC